MEVALKDTLKFGVIAKRILPEEDGEGSSEVRWERHIESMPDVPATIERVTGILPWTLSVEFERNGERERWLLRRFLPFTQVPE